MIPADNHLGDKIRLLRLQRGITQKDLAGEKITRNMLSLIESGSASPSVSTLLYISERLETPVGYFFSNTAEDEARFFKMSVIEQLKAAFEAKRYHECESICDSIPDTAIDDELSYILAFSYINTSSEAAIQMNIAAAYSDLEKASLYATKSIYCSDSFTSALLYFRELLTSACSDSIPDILCDMSMCGEFIPNETIRYFTVLKSRDDPTGFAESFRRGSFYYKHLNALGLLVQGQTVDAQKKLRELSLDPNLPYYMQYRVLCDLENAANTSGDLRLAYSSARRKIEFIEKFRI